MDQCFYYYTQLSRLSVLNDLFDVRFISTTNITVARVPSNLVHSVRAITNCKVINIFYPVREDFNAG